MKTQVRAFVAAERSAGGNVAKTCQLLEVSRSAFYDSIDRPASARERSDAELSVMIKAAHARSRGTYGAPRIHDELIDAGIHVGRKRVARLMADAGLVGVCARRSRRTTIAGEEARVANILNRVFGPENWEVDQAWCSDITYVRTWEGWAYLVTIIDLATRQVVGWALGDNMETTLVTEAFLMAVASRRPAPGLLFHSDRGSQYCSGEFRALLQAHGVVQSLSRVGQCWDNAVSESWFGTYKNELVYTRSWPTIAALRRATFNYIEIFYNRQRRHSALGGVSPACYERTRQAVAAQAA